MNMAFKSDSAGVLRRYVGDSVYAWQEGIRHLCIPLEDKAYLIIFDWCDIADTSKTEERVTVFCNEKDFVLISDNLGLPETEGESDKTSSMRMLEMFFNMLIEGDIDTLDAMEDEFGVLEEELITSKELKKDTGTRIVIFKRTLLKMKRYYEQLSAVADMLALDEAEAMPKKLKNRFVALSHRIDHLEATVAHLREYVTQIREAYQAQIDIEQNQIMKIFTVITAIFLPLSLIVGWYGMNFAMPEYGWKFGYLFVIIFSVAVCCFMYRFIKRKRWF